MYLLLFELLVENKKYKNFFREVARPMDFKKYCSVCYKEFGIKDDILTCKTCDKRYHPTCLTRSTRTKIDKENFYCHMCKDSNKFQ